MVWQDTRQQGSSNIYGYDLAAGREFPVCTAAAGQFYPAISGDVVVWEDYRNPSTGPDIYGKNLSAGEEFAICIAPGGQYAPAISGNLVVWQDYRNSATGEDIYAKDLSTGREFAVCTAPGAQRYPAISANIVVWTDWRNSATTVSDIYGRDLSTGREFPICSAPEEQKHPAVSGKIVVWDDWRDSHTGGTSQDIYGYDLSRGTEFPICTAPASQVLPAVSGDIVVWQDTRNYPASRSDIYGYDFANGQEFLICSAVGHRSYPAVCGSLVVWTDERSGDWNIYGYRLDGSYWPPDQYGPDLPSDHVRHFLTGQLHAHWMSEWVSGHQAPVNLTPKGLETLYQALGYEFIAPTEHVEFQKALAPGMYEDPHVAGIIHLGDSMEDTALDSHILAAAFNHLGHSFRPEIVGQCPEDDADNELYRGERLDNIRDDGGGLAFVAHPDVRKYLWSDQSLMHLFGHYDGIEVFNAAAQLTPYRATALGTWTTLLQSGKAVHAVAGDDYTTPWVSATDRGCVTVVADVPSDRAYTKDDIKQQLQAGRFYVSYAPARTCGVGRASLAPKIEGWWWDDAAQRARIRVSSASGIRRVSFFTGQKPDGGQEVSLSQVGDSWEGSYSCTTDDKWVRAEARDWLGRVSLTQPIWLDPLESATGQWQAGAPSRSGDTPPQKLVLDLAAAHLELPAASSGAELWGNLVAQADRPAVAPPLGYIGYCYSFQTNAPVPAGTTLILSYDPGLIQLCQEDALAIYHYNPLQNTWAAVAGTVDQVNHKVSATLAELGTYALSADLPEDTLAPDVNILVSEGATLSGPTEVAAEITDDNGVASAQFLLDDTLLGTDTLGSDGWQVTFDFSVIAQGSHTLRVIAKDAAGNEQEASVPVVVSSTVPTPGITISAPTAGAYMWGQFQAAGAWNASKPLAGGLLSMDGFSLAALVPDAQGDHWTADVALPSFDPGAHTLRVTGSDEDGNEVAAEIAVTVPAVTLSSGYVTPSSGDTTTKFTWRIKYWNTANVAPTSVQVAVWSSATKSTSWRQMWALDPADALCTDGKWYTYSCYLTAGDYAYRFAAQAGGSWAYWPQPAGAYQPGPTVTPANPVALSGGYVTPSSGTGATQFTWRIKYWNTGNAPPDEIKVAIWFPTLKKTYWYSMWAYDPADTNCKDGKWYTFSRKWLPPGAYAYRFAARQGTNWAYWPAPAGSYASGPTVGP